MKLNNRVHLLVLPVLVVSFIAITLGLYAIERRSILDLAQSAANAEVTELNSLFNSYGLIAGGFLSSIIQSDNLRTYLSSDDDQFKALALSGGLDNLINSLTELSADHFSFAFIRGDGILDYYYENSDDPFAELDPQQAEWVGLLIAKGEDFKTHYFQGGQPRLVYCRIIDTLTLKAPAKYGSSSSLAILVAIEPTRFMERRRELQTNGRRVQVWPERSEPPTPLPLEVRQPMTGGGILAIQLDRAQVQASLRQALLIPGGALAVLIVLTYLALHFLLGRYVTGPIAALEQHLTAVDLQADAALALEERDDEIGNLGKTFAGLYARLQAAYQTTRVLAERDPLTGLYNRRMFLHQLKEILELAEESDKVALVYIDVDNFKYVNDRFGHTTGDALLKSFAQRLLKEVEEGPEAEDGNRRLVVSRLAGDEFAAIVGAVADTREAGRIARRILAICKDGFHCEAGYFAVGLSIGVALYPDDGQTSEILISNADSAMYQAKKGGRNQISFYSGRLAEMHRRQEAIERELKQLRLEELEVNYMPMVMATTGRLTGFELLLRWQCSTLGLLLPNEFMALAESSGTFHQMDLWILEQAFEQGPRIRDRFGADLMLSVNISAAELSRPDFVAAILPLVEKYQIDPSGFCIEINETFCQGNQAEATKMLQFLHGVGFQLAIEGLGAGYSSLLQLVEFPVRYIKLDRNLVANSIQSGRHRILKSLIEFCHVQDLEVVAEGVEEVEQAQWLAANGCDYLQGYLYSRPVSLKQLLAAEFSWRPAG